MYPSHHFESASPACGASGQRADQCEADSDAGASSGIAPQLVRCSSSTSDSRASRSYSEAADPPLERSTGAPCAWGSALPPFVMATMPLLGTFVAASMPLLESESEGAQQGSRSSLLAGCAQ